MVKNIKVSCSDLNNDQSCDYCGGSLICKHIWKDGKCTLCDKVCPHESTSCSSSGKYKDSSLIELPEEFHEEYIKCGVCGYDKVSTVREPHAWEDGECSDCGYVCKHDYYEGKCTICNFVKSESSYDVNYGTWGDSLIFSKDAKYEKTNFGYRFVRLHEYIGGVNLLDLHELDYDIKKTSELMIQSMGCNTLTVRDNLGLAVTEYPCYITFSLSPIKSRLENGEEYTLSYVVDSPWKYCSVQIRETDLSGNAKTYKSVPISSENSFSFTYNGSYNYDLIFRTNGSATESYGSSFSATFSNLQLEKSGEMTTYTPFGILRLFDYDEVYDKAYKDAIANLDGKEVSGGLVKGLIDSVWGITQDCFERLDKATTINGISVGGIISTMVVFLIVFFVLKLVNK